MNKARFSVLTAAVAATLIVGFGVAPANADVESVSGSRTCPVGQTLAVSVTTELYDSVKYYLGGNLRYTDAVGYTHYYNYGSRSGSWKVTSIGNILTAYDSCTRALIAGQ